MVIPIVVALVTLVLHVLVAGAVYRSASQMAGRRPLLFFGPVGWMFVGFLTGLLGLIAFWAMHLSTLAPRDEGNDGKIPS